MASSDDYSIASSAVSLLSKWKDDTKDLVPDLAERQLLIRIVAALDEAFQAGAVQAAREEMRMQRARAAIGKKSP